MTINEAARHLLLQLKQTYDAREAGNIADWVMENLTGSKKSDRILQKELPLTEMLCNKLNRYINELNLHRPVQYVLEEAWFLGMKFYVNENVLIPRPETEELVQWIVDDNKNSGQVTIFDIGTGSGCIPIALKKIMQLADVYSCDISEEALEVAKENAKVLGANVKFLTIDILDRPVWNKIPLINIIVSNPPYIPMKEKLSMNKNVVAHEPHQALFVEDSNPLAFYESIAALGNKKLLPSGKIFVEIHEGLAKETAEVFKSAGFAQVEIKTDMQGKQRMIKAALLHPGLIYH